MISRWLAFLSPHEAADEASRRKIKLRIVIILGLLLLLFLLLAGGWYWKNHRTLSKYAVEGNREVTEAEIISLAKVKKGTRLSLVSPAVVRKRLKKNPMIESAEVRAELPGTLVIEVREREPVVRLEGQVSGMLDGNGFGMPMKQKTVYDLPILSGIRKTDFDSAWGQIKRPELRKVASELTKLKKKVPAAYNLISELRPADDQSVWVYTFDGSVPVLASIRNLAGNMIVLKSFWNQVVTVSGKERFTYIDVRQDGVIATKEQ